MDRSERSFGNAATVGGFIMNRGHRRLRTRGQVLPIVAIFLSVFGVLAWFLFDVSGYRTAASTAMNSALRSGGLAALDQRDPNQDQFGRWYVDPIAGDNAARTYVLANLRGNSSGEGGYAKLFVGDLAADISHGITDVGLDVEILNPASVPGQESRSFFNGMPENAILCQDSYPQGLLSVIDNNCYNSATIILHLRLNVRQIIGSSTTADKIVAIRAGTDAQ